MHFCIFVHLVWWFRFCFWFICNVFSHSYSMISSMDSAWICLLFETDFDRCLCFSHVFPLTYSLCETIKNDEHYLTLACSGTSEKSSVMIPRLQFGSKCLHCFLWVLEKQLLVWSIWHQFPIFSMFDLFMDLRFFCFLNWTFGSTQLLKGTPKASTKHEITYIFNVVPVAEFFAFLVLFWHPLGRFGTFWYRFGYFGINPSTSM